MKRIVTTTILLASVLATSCRTDSTNGEWLPVGDEVMFTGGVPTRTDISETDGNLAVTWRETDEVGIYGIRGENVLGGNYGYSAVPGTMDPNASAEDNMGEIPGYRAVADAQTLKAFHIRRGLASFP